MPKTLPEIEEDVITCTRCNLHSKRTQPVIGSYPIKKNGILFIGEAPHKLEDTIGIPMLGGTGRVFTTCIYETLGLERKDYNILYCVKCFPNIKNIKIEPEQESIFWCAEYLYEQIHLLEPSIIITLGNIALLALLRRRDFFFKKRKRINTNKFMGHLYKAKSIIYNEEYYVVPLRDPFKWLKCKKIREEAKEQLLLVSNYLDEIKSGKSMEDILRNSPSVS